MKIKRLQKDILNRKLFLETEIVQLVLKTVLFYLANPIYSCLVYKKLLSFSKVIVFKSAVKNFCIVSGRFRAVNRLFRVSRIVLRELGATGLFFGLKKSSW